MKTKILALAVLVASFICTPVYADYSYQLESDNKPNLVNLYLDVVKVGTFQESTSLPSGWYYWQNAAGTQAQVFTLASSPTTTNVNWYQWFNANPGLGAHISYQEVYWNYTTNTWTQAWAGGLIFTKDNPGLGETHWTYSSYTGGLTITAPHTEAVPIPSPVWLLGAGLVVVGVTRKRIHR